MCVFVIYAQRYHDPFISIQQKNAIVYNQLRCEVEYQKGRHHVYTQNSIATSFLSRLLSEFRAKTFGFSIMPI